MFELFIFTLGKCLKWDYVFKLIACQLKQFGRDLMAVEE